MVRIVVPFVSLELIHEILKYMTETLSGLLLQCGFVEIEVLVVINVVVVSVDPGVVNKATLAEWKFILVVDAVDGSQFIEVVAFLVNFEVVGSVVAMVVVVGVVVSFVVEAVEGIAVEVVYSFSTVLEQSWFTVHECLLCDVLQS